jgi:dipeptidyl aminopeptidase/acylaminoacyl peptidase
MVPVVAPVPVPVEMCVGQRELSEPRMSPDGARLGWMVSRAGMVVLALTDLATGEQGSYALEAGLRGGRSMGGGSWVWMPDSTAVVVAAADGALWRLPLDGTPPSRWFTPGEGRSAWSPCVGVRNGVTPIVVCTVDQAEVWASDGATSWRLDDSSADFVSDPCVVGERAWWTAWDVPSMPWDISRLETVNVDGTGRSVVAGVGAVQQPRPHPDGRMTCVRDDGGWNNVWLDGRPLVAEQFEHAGPPWGPGARSFAWSPDGTRLAFTRNERGFGRLCVWSADGVAEVARGVHGQLSWVGASLGALRTGARTPTEVVVFDTDTWERRELDVGPDSAWRTRRESLAEPDIWTVGEVHARVYLTDAESPRGAIVWLHGGPTDQWQVTFMPRIEYWRTRGWHIVVPDHRGSTGHGREYAQALRGRWGDLDVIDTITVLEAVHARGLATPDSTVLFGGSAGGFTALESACHRPDLVAGVGVAYPVTDLADLAARSHRFEAHYTVGLVGPLPETRDLHDARSPVCHPERIVGVPVLILHGDADPVVPVDHSRAFAVAARAAGADVTLHEYPGEGHGFRDAAHQRDEYLRLGAFLDRVVPSGQG